MPVSVNITFYHRSEKTPEMDARIFCISPEYVGRDKNMLYRVMDGQFLKISQDVEFWAYADVFEQIGGIEAAKKMFESQLGDRKTD